MLNWFIILTTVLLFFIILNQHMQTDRLEEIIELLNSTKIESLRFPETPAV